MRFPACLILALAAVPTAAQPHLEALPPLVPWDGASRDLVLPADHEWVTPSEVSGLTSTPSYDETMAWLERLAAATDDVELVTIGTSAEGRAIRMAIVSRESDKSPAGLAAAGRPLILAQGGIHSGEIDGKDAGLMLLRDLTVVGSRAELLDGVDLLFVPILSVDGHERSGPRQRINQRGPAEMGWRTNARNLNLNRDYAKLETEGVRAVVDVIHRWQPDLYVDLHVTDGADYQYDITWDMVPESSWSPAIARWSRDVLAPAVNGLLTDRGHVPGPLVWPVDGANPANGNVVWMGSPRFSNTYGSARQLPTILVENHSLKPYDQRVLGTYVFLEALLGRVAEEAESLAAATAADRARRPDPVTLDWKVATPPRTETRSFLGISSESRESPVTGAEILHWTGRPIEIEVPFVLIDEPAARARRPAYYYIPSAWSSIAEKLRQHGVEVETVTEAATVEVERLRLPEAGLSGGGSSFDHSGTAYEGRVRVAPGDLVAERGTLELAAGDHRVATDQPLGTLTVLLLEPAAPDSFFQWGFFLEILTQPEYAEAYVMDPLGQRLLAEDAELAAAFEARLEDPDFAADPRARLEWLYRRSGYYDERHRLYPIARSID